MSVKKRYCIKMLHCGNANITNPNDHTDKNVFYMPMGFFPLANVLRENDFDIEIVHFDIEQGQSIDQILDLENIDAVGFNCHWVNQSLGVLDTAALIKKINPNIYIFVGGFTASLFANEIVGTYKQIDAVLRGDGEVPILELCTQLRTNKQCREPNNNLGYIQNLVWKRNEEVITNEFTYVGTAEEMEKLDFAAMDLLRNWKVYQTFSKFWTRFEPIASSPLFLLEVGRGCSYACVFCGGNCEAQSKMNNRKGYVIRSIDSVIKTIQKAVSLGYETFYTCFEFNDSDEWYIQLFKTLKEKSIKINYVFGAWKLPSKKLIDAMSEACPNVMFEISPETYNETLRKTNKDTRIFYSNQELDECLAYIKEKGNIRVQLYFGYFLAFDDRETVLSTMRYILDLNMKYASILEAEYFNFSTDPGSLLFFHPEKFDIDIKVKNFSDYVRFIREKYVVEKSNSPDLRVFKPNSMLEEESIELEGKIKFFNYLFSSFRKTISFILNRYSNIDMIMTFLDEAKSVKEENNLFNTDLVKEKLVKYCIEYDMTDIELIKRINDDYNNHKKDSQNLKSTPQLWIEDEVVDNTIIDLDLQEETMQEDISIELEFDF